MYHANSHSLWQLETITTCFQQRFWLFSSQRIQQIPVLQFLACSRSTYQRKTRKRTRDFSCSFARKVEKSENKSCSHDTKKKKRKENRKRGRRTRLFCSLRFTFQIYVTRTNVHKMFTFPVLLPLFHFFLFSLLFSNFKISWKFWENVFFFLNKLKIYKSKCKKTC